MTLKLKQKRPERNMCFANHRSQAKPQFQLQTVIEFIVKVKKVCFRYFKCI